MSKNYFIYRRIEFWFLCRFWNILCIAFPIREVKIWAYNRRCDYAGDRLFETRLAIQKAEAQLEHE